MAKKFPIRWPRFRNPLKNPVNLTQIQKNLFGKKSAKSFRWSWKTAGKIFLWGLAAFVLIIVFLFAWYAKDLPTPGKLKTLIAASGSTRLYDRNGGALYTISGDKRQIVIDSNQIPQNVKQATVAIEDKRFYSNPGVDVRGIARAAFVDLFHRGGLQGASTITQQLVKQTVVNGTSRSLTYKIKDAIVAIEVEALFTKDEILTMYLNAIPYGGNNYGIEAAARAFYGVSAKDLTLSQAATLASLPQRPTTLSPYGPHTDLLLQRRNYTLDVMTKQGNITTAQAKDAKAQALGTIARGAADSSTAPHFVQYVKDWLVSYFKAQLGDEQLAEAKVEDGGLKVVTTLDPSKQGLAEQAIQQGVATTLKRAGASNASMVSLDPKTGQILAMVGSIDYSNSKFGQVNMAVSPRQPGSSFKPIVYATAFKGSFSPGTTLFDLKTDFGGGYVPQNYTGGFVGPITIRNAIGNSLNIPAVKTLGLIGVDQALKTASDLGITTLGTDPGKYGLSLALGSGEVRVVDMAAAYGAFANNGMAMGSTPILKITDSSNKVLVDNTNPPAGKQVLDPAIAYEISNMLSDVNAKKPEFARVLNVLTLPNRPVATKTGTSNNTRDAWTIGYTPQLVTAVWAGNNDNTPMGSASIGAIAAAPMWEQFMQNALKDQPVVQFDKPSTVTTATIDRYSNLLPSPNDPATTTDIFAPWQIPTKPDGTHVSVRVCRENGLPADSSIPDALTTTKIFTAVHSEMPNNPNWEGPVHAWAVANGLYGPPPSDKCTSGNNTAPTVTITSPANHATVSGPTAIAADASAPSGVASVQFSIDNTAIATDSDAPYSTSYDMNQLTSGSHTISALVTSSSGSTATSQITVTVSSDTTAPHEVSSFNGTAIVGGVTLTWANPNDSDFVTTRIYYRRQNSGSVYTVLPVNGAPGSSGNATITGLAHVAYEFVAKTVDSSGNESSGTTIFLTPL
ncbi:MAG TPA: transglycosylase domain-containing protein [Candidatus Saccharimonadales bacterium]|nr:transglycosylase domain-containing protein [Candidatus Saccharimonadales bacterium]